jgi:hypothetical protein
MRPVPAFPFSLGSFVAGSMWSISSRSRDPHTAHALSVSHSPLRAASHSRWYVLRSGRCLCFADCRRPRSRSHCRHTRLPSRRIRVFSGVYSWFHLQWVFGVFREAGEGLKRR